MALRVVATFVLTLVSLTALASPPKTENHYIVVFKDRVQVQKTIAELRTLYKIKINVTFTYALQGFTAIIPPSLVPIIQKDPRVDFVEPDLPVKKFPTTIHKIYQPSPIKHPPPTNSGIDDPSSIQIIPTGIRRMKVLNNPTANIDGKDGRVNVDVAVIDSGVDSEHPDLNVFRTVNFSAEDNPTDLDGHGTHVAGIIGALDNKIGVVGVAPGARIWSIKVLDSTGKGRTSGIIKAIDYVTEHADEIEIANMSLGSSGLSRGMHKAIKNSVKVGVFYAVAAGNESTDVYGEDRVYGTSDDINPASYPEVSAVSAMADSDGQAGGHGLIPENLELDDTLATFSNFSTNIIGQHKVQSRGAAIDLAAPGIAILSCYKNGSYSNMSGTSMASPHIAGLAALYIAQYGRARTEYGVTRIRQTLVDFSQSQRLWNKEISTLDPDDNPEGLGDAEAISRLGSS